MREKDFLQENAEYFNSSMVRLKGNVENFTDVEHEFQFQYGAIKSFIKSQFQQIFNRISIPVWCD